MSRDKYTECRALEEDLAALTREEAEEIRNAPQSIKLRYAAKRQKRIRRLSDEAREFAIKLEHVSRAEVELAMKSEASTSDKSERATVPDGARRGRAE